MSEQREFNIERLSRRIKIAAEKRGLRHDVADCIQEILTRMLEGKHQHSTIDQCVIDFIREKHGRPGLPGYAAKYALSVASSLEGPDDDRPVQIGVRATVGDRLDFDRYRGMFNKRERRILQLSVEGYTNAAIGLREGVSESRITQLMNAIRKKVSDFEVKESVVQQITQRMRDTEGKKWVIHHCLFRADQETSAS